MLVARSGSRSPLPFSSRAGSPVRDRQRSAAEGTHPRKIRQRHLTPGKRVSSSGTISLFSMDQLLAGLVGCQFLHHCKTYKYRAICAVAVVLDLPGGLGAISQQNRSPWLLRIGQMFSGVRILGTLSPERRPLLTRTGTPLGRRRGPANGRASRRRTGRCGGTSGGIRPDLDSLSPITRGIPESENRGEWHALRAGQLA